jgi:hypothetical protein
MNGHDITLCTEIPRITHCDILTIPQARNNNVIICKSRNQRLVIYSPKRSEQNRILNDLETTNQYNIELHKTLIEMVATFSRVIIHPFRHRQFA